MEAKGPAPKATTRHLATEPKKQTVESPRRTKTVESPRRTKADPPSVPQDQLKKKRKVTFDEAQEGASLLKAVRRQQNKIVRSVANLEYLELHKRAKRKQQKEEEPTSTQQPEDFPPTDRPPDERPPDPPPPVRDKATRKLEGAKKSPRGAEKSREKSRLGTRPHETRPPRADKHHMEIGHAEKQGEPLSLMQPQPLSHIHPFATTLQEWEKGIQVNCGPEWDIATCEAAVERGPHPSALTTEAINLFAEDIHIYVRRRTANSQVKHLLPPL